MREKKYYQFYTVKIRSILGIERMEKGKEEESITGRTGVSTRVCGKTMFLMERGGSSMLKEMYMKVIS